MNNEETPDKRQQNPKVWEALESDKFTTAEKCVIKWQYRIYGKFYTKLFDAIQQADHSNMEHLRRAFP